MADGLGIQYTTTSPAMGGASVSSHAADAAATLPGSRPQTDASAQSPASNVGIGTSYAPDIPEVQSKVVARLLQQNATIYGPGLAQIPLPSRPDGMPRLAPKKPAGPMVAPRTLEGGQSPLAPGSLFDARASVDGIGEQPDDLGETQVLANAKNGAWRMPSRHGLVAYTTNARGDSVYLTQERWLHIRENHMDQSPQPRGKRTTTFWPTSHAIAGPSMNEQQVIGVIVDAARKGTLRTEVRDTRMSEYDLPADQAAAYGVSEAKVSMAPDGLVLSAYPGAGDNVLAVYEMSEADQVELARVQSNRTNTSGQVDDRMFQTNVAATTFG